MAVQFKKKVSADRMIYPSAVYPDLYDNNKTTTDIQIGSVAGVTGTSLMLGDFTMPVKNAFGDSKLVGAKLGLYINSITRDNSLGGIPGFKVFKVPVNIGDREGGKTSAGSLISLSDFAQICSYHEGAAIVEDFKASDDVVEEKTEVVQDVIIRKHGPFISRNNGYRYGYRFGGKAGDLTKISTRKHFKRFGETLPDGTEVYKLEFHRNRIDKNRKRWKSKRENKHWARFNHEMWYPDDVGGTEKYEFSKKKDSRIDMIQYESTETVQRSNTDELVQRANTTNTFFDDVQEAPTFKIADDDVGGTIKKVAYGDVALTTTKVRSGGQSLHMHNVYPHRDAQISDINYVKGTNDNTENHQTTFVTKQLPLPLHQYSARTISSNGTNDSGGGQGKTKPLVSTVSICLNIDSLAPILRRRVLAEHENNSFNEALTEITQEHRLNRSLCVTFGEEKPIAGERLYDYVKRHAPDSHTHAKTGLEGAAFSWDGTTVTVTYNSHPYSVTQQVRLEFKTIVGTQNMPSDGKYAITSKTTNSFTVTVSETSDGVQTGTVDATFGETYHFLGSNNNKSFMGLAIVNVGGKYGLAKLSRAHTDGSTPFATSQYTEVDFGLDRARGEVVVTPNTTTGLISKSIEGKFLNLDFQFHPDGSHAHFGIYDPETGDMHTKETGAPRIYNIKNTSASGAGLWAHNDSTNFPRYMTIWNTNFQAINGPYDASVKKYKTGLKVAEAIASSSSTKLLPVYAARVTGLSSIFQGAQSQNLSAYLNLAAGDKLRVGSTDDIIVARKNPAVSANNFPVIEVKDNLPDISVDSEIFFMHTVNADFYVNTPATMENSVFIDSITLNNFNMEHGNATPSSSNPTPSRLKIPATYKNNAPGYYYNYSTQSGVTNVRDNLADFPSYLCFGFDNITDFEGSSKFMLLNGFKVSGANDEIYLGSVENIVDPEDSNASLSTGDIDSELTCVRVGYTSFEDYGRQGASDSYSKLIDGGSNPEAAISQIPNQSSTFDNSQGTTYSQRRGLLVGDLGVDSAEFSLHPNDTFNVDAFTQKGFIQWNFDRRESNLGQSGTLVEVNQGTVNQSATQFTVKNITSGTTTLQVNNFIRINNEIMLIKDIADTGAVGGIHTLLVKRAQAGTTAGTHSQNDDVHLVALPEKRESIFTSARVLNVVDSNTLEIDSPELFKFDESQEYLLYIYGDSHATPTLPWPITLKATTKNNSQITFDKRHHISEGQEYKFLISPKKYWLMVEVHNHTDGPLDRKDITTVTKTETVFHEKTVVTNPNLTDRVVILDEALNATETKINLLQGDPIGIKIGDVIQIGEEKMLVVAVDASSDPSTIGVKRGVFGTTATTHQKKSTLHFAARRYLPEKSYDSAVMLTGLPNGSHSSFGATFNETLYNDGNYINSWDLDPFIKEDDTAIDLKDYGFGDFDEEDKSGGHLAHLNLNVQNDVTTYKELDISGVVKVDKVSDNDTFTVMITPDEPTDSYKINVDTEDGTNPVYMTAIYEDELPKITDFKIKPNEKDPFFVDYNWKCNDEDVWYGFLHVSDENINDQYHGAVMHIPMNDDAADLESLTYKTDSDGDDALDTDAFDVLDSEGNLLTAAKFKDSIVSGNHLPKHTIEGLAGNAIKFDSNDLIIVGASDNNNFDTITKEMSVVIHAINDNPSFNSGNDQYIINKANSLTNFSLQIFGRRVGITNTGQIVVRMMSDGETTNTKYVELTSSTIIEKDVPLNIIVTFDANLYRGNCKLFINGRLEDQSGDVLASHAVGNNTGWIHKQSLFSDTAPLNIGGKFASITSNGWNGTLEEIVIYNKLIYPVDVKSGSFTFTKPLEELTSEAASNSKNYNARLFVKDYHNIRGSSKEDVATTASISYRKAAFNLNGVAD